MKNSARFIISIAMPQVVGFSAALITNKYINGYFNQQLIKPGWNPPGYLFGPVWTTLYVLMGIALYKIWKSDASKPVKTQSIVLWSIQMFFNFWWSIIYFKEQDIGLALIDICLLWLTILLTIFSFARISKTAAWLLVPYISWVSFAAYLNYTIWTLNG